MSFYLQCCRIKCVANFPRIIIRTLTYSMKKVVKKLLCWMFFMVSSQDTVYLANAINIFAVTTENFDVAFR